MSFFEGVRNSSFTANFLVWEKQYKQHTKKGIFNEKNQNCCEIFTENMDIKKDRLKVVDRQ